MWFRQSHLVINILCFPGGSGNNLPANLGDMGSIPGLERSPGQRKGNTLQYFSLGTPMDKGTWQATVPWADKRVKQDIATKQQRLFVWPMETWFQMLLYTDIHWPHGLGYFLTFHACFLISKVSIVAIFHGPVIKIRCDVIKAWEAISVYLSAGVHVLCPTLPSLESKICFSEIMTPPRFFSLFMNSRCIPFWVEQLIYVVKITSFTNTLEDSALCRDILPVINVFLHMLTKEDHLPILLTLFP